MKHIGIKKERLPRKEFLRGKRKENKIDIDLNGETF